MPRRSVPLKKVFLLLAFLLNTAVFTTPSLADNFDVNVTFSQTGAISGLKVYAFTGGGSYTGMNVTTDAGGTAIFDKADFAEGTYKFRVDYLNGQFWSDVASIPQDSAISVIIEEGSVDVSVRNQAEPLSGIKVYLFNSAGAYLGKNATTDTGGLVHFVLPVGMAVKFRADDLNYQFWSDPTSVVAPLTSIDLLIPYQNVTITVNGTYQSASDPIEGIKPTCLPLRVPTWGRPGRQTQTAR